MARLWDAGLWDTGLWDGDAVSEAIVTAGSIEIVGQTATAGVSTSAFADSGTIEIVGQPIFATIPTTVQAGAIEIRGFQVSVDVTAFASVISGVIRISGAGVTLHLTARENAGLPDPERIAHVLAENRGVKADPETRMAIAVREDRQSTSPPERRRVVI